MTQLSHGVIDVLSRDVTRSQMFDHCRRQFFHYGPKNNRVRILGDYIQQHSP